MQKRKPTPHLPSHLSHVFTYFVDPQTSRSMMICLSALESTNGFVRNGILTTHYSEKSSQDSSPAHTVLRQTFDMSQYQNLLSTLTPEQTSGAISSKGKNMNWEFKIAPAQNISQTLTPFVLTKTGAYSCLFKTHSEDSRFNGKVQMNDQTISWNNAQGMIASMNGSKNPFWWAYAFCNSFKNEKNDSSTLIFEGYALKEKFFNLIRTPMIWMYSFCYNGQVYRFEFLKDIFKVHSTVRDTEWSFQAEKKGLRFEGVLSVPHKSIAGISFEDVDGGLMYHSQSLNAELRISVYRDGKLENTFHAERSSYFLTASRNKSPYIQYLI